MDTQIKTNPVGKVAVSNDVPKAPLRMSYEEYLAWSDENKVVEWVDGEVIEFMPPKVIHQTLNSFLHKLLSIFVELFNLGYVGIAPLEVRINKTTSYEPDLVFVSRKHMRIVNDDRIDGVPDLIVEIVSKDSVQRDREDKFDEYESAGVREYWIIDNRPRRYSAEFYHLNRDGHYDRMEVVNNIFRSEALPGFWLHTDWLWQKFPNALAALDEMVGLEKLARQFKRNNCAISNHYLLITNYFFLNGKENLLPALAGLL
jgi:Uma2 family endonuclease